MQDIPLQAHIDLLVLDDADPATVHRVFRDFEVFIGRNLLVGDKKGAICDIGMGSKRFPAHTGTVFHVKSDEDDLPEFVSNFIFEQLLLKGFPSMVVILAHTKPQPDQPHHLDHMCAWFIDALGQREVYRKINTAPCTQAAHDYQPPFLEALLASGISFMQSLACRADLDDTTVDNRPPPHPGPRL